MKDRVPANTRSFWRIFAQRQKRSPDPLEQILLTLPRVTPEERTSSDHWKYAVLFAVVLLSRLPFLNAGYGVEIDGWRVALAARHIAQNGVYEVSRFPGYPLQ